MKIYAILLCYFTISIAIGQQVHNHTIYHFIPSYSEYQKLFAQKAGQKNTIEMTQYGTGNQICQKNEVCRFYIYLYQPDVKENIQHTVFISAGMHGNELIGPTALFYLYQLLKPDRTRIVYFPICNPSGYVRKKRQTYPGGIDINRDYPIDNNKDCYQSSATRIIDKIYRQYEIDLTINLHNGDDQIAWNWGTKFHKNNSFTQDQEIYLNIGQMLYFYGGFNKKIGIKPFKIGTMNQVVYPAKGTLDDWAYAGSWHESTSKQCNSYNYQPYPQNMHKGLVFLFQLGKHNAPQNMLGTSQGLDLPSTSNKISNGYITRTIRMLKALIKVVNPVFSAQAIDNMVYIKIQGCSEVSKLQIKIIGQNQNEQNIESFKLTTIINSYTSLSTLEITNRELIEANKLKIQYKFQCDIQWRKIGKSFLSSQRKFQSTIQIQKTDQMEINTNFLKINGEKAFPKINIFIIVVIIIIILSVFMLICIIKRKNKQKSAIRKFIDSDKLAQSQMTEVQKIEPQQDQFSQRSGQKSLGQITVKSQTITKLGE